MNMFSDKDADFPELLRPGKWRVCNALVKHYHFFVHAVVSLTYPGREAGAVSAVTPMHSGGGGSGGGGGGGGGGAELLLLAITLLRVAPRPPCPHEIRQ